MLVRLELHVELSAGATCTRSANIIYYAQPRFGGGGAPEPPPPPYTVGTFILNVGAILFLFPREGGAREGTEGGGGGLATTLAAYLLSARLLRYKYSDSM